MSLKLISLNIEGDRHYDRIIPFLTRENPDVICLQELFEVDIPFLTKKLNRSIFYLPMLNIIKPTKRISAKGSFGLGIITSLPSQPASSRYYCGQPQQLPEFIHPDSDNRALFWTIVKKNSASFTIATTHFTRTPDGKPNPKQKKDLNNLLKILKTLPHFILCGDFNAPRQYSVFKTLSKHYQNHIPDSTKTTLDPLLHYANRHHPGKLKFVVDHLFTTPPYTVNSIRVQCGLSDHCAVIAEIDKL